MTLLLIIYMNLIIYQLICCVLSTHKTDEVTEDIGYLLKVTCFTRASLKNFFPRHYEPKSMVLAFYILSTLPRILFHQKGA